MPLSVRLLRSINKVLGDRTLKDLRDDLQFADAGHGFDAFGMQPDFVAFASLLNSPLYKHYFRVSSHGAEHIPSKGAAILAANHSGSLPFDAMMLWNDALRNSHPTRVPRPVADYFVSSLPFIGTLFARSGVVSGSRGNVRNLLENGELLMLFPEGTPGIGKPYKDRYKLQTWRKGHCELAIRHSAQVVPVGIVGPEEQMPQIGRIPLEFLGTGVPYIPVTATPLPMPVHYHIYYGEPLPFHEDYSPDDADDPELVQEAADRVRAEVEKLLHKGLSEREGVFR